MRALPDGPPRFLIAKPGLDGHSNGAEQIAVAARDAGMEVIYDGIRSTPAQIAAIARDEDPDAIGLSILSGSHLELVPATLDQLKAEGVDVPVVVGGIIPAEDQPQLLALGVAAVFTPKDYQTGRDHRCARRSCDRRSSPTRRCSGLVSALGRSRPSNPGSRKPRFQKLSVRRETADKSHQRSKPNRRCGTLDTNAQDTNPMTRTP